MMTPPLIAGSLLAGRYVVKSGASFDADRRVYLVRDSQQRGASAIVVQEIIVSGHDPDDAASRRALLLEAVQVAAQFEHERLCPVREFFFEGNRAYLVMDFIEGVTLQTILDMGHHGVREASALHWTRQIAEAMKYLHERSEPFELAALEPSFVVVTPRDDVVLVDFNVRRFFAPGTPASALQAASVADLRLLGRMLLTLLVPHQRAVDDALAELPSHAHPATVKLTHSLLQGEYDDVDAAISAIDACHVERAEPSSDAAADAGPDPFVRRALVLASIGVLAIAIVLGMQGMMTGEGQTPARLWVLGADSELIPVTLNGRVEGDVIRIPGGRLTELKYVRHSGTLVLADAGPRLFFVRPPATHVAECRLESPARGLKLSKTQRDLFCIEGTGVVSQVAIAAHRRLRAWTLGGRLCALAESADGRYLYASDTDASVIHTVDLTSGRQVGTTLIPGGPGPLLVDAAGRLWTALEDAGRLAPLSIRADGQPKLDRTDFEALHDYVTDLRVTADGLFLYALCRDSHKIAVFDAATHRLTRHIDTVAWQPLGWTFSDNPPQVYVVSEGSSQIATVDTKQHRYVRGLRLPSRARAIDYAP